MKSIIFHAGLALILPLMAYVGLRPWYQKKIAPGGKKNIIISTIKCQEDKTLRSIALGCASERHSERARAQRAAVRAPQCTRQNAPRMRLAGTRPCRIQRAPSRGRCATLPGRLAPAPILPAPRAPAPRRRAQFAPRMLLAGAPQPCAAQSRPGVRPRNLCYLRHVRQCHHAAPHRSLSCRVLHHCHTPPAVRGPARCAARTTSRIARLDACSPS